MNTTNLIEMKISNQGLINNGWKLLKKFKDNSYHYYALVECIDCGKQELVNYYNFISKRFTHPCRNCKIGYKHLIGKICGPFKILEIDHINKTKTGQYQVYVKTECIYCHNIKILLYNASNWKKQVKCINCKSSFNDKYLNILLKGYKDGAKIRNIKWNLTNDEFSMLVSGNCYYCGAAPIKHTRYKVIGYSNGIDRINSNLDYNITNCVSCCAKCNVMKLNYTVDEFLSHISNIYNHQIKQGSTTIETTSNNDGKE